MTDIKDRPDYPNTSYTYMNASWSRTQDVFGGVRTIRESNTDYLIKFEKESDADFANRKKSTEFFNVFGGTVRTVVGMVCHKDIAPTDAPPALQELFGDIDLCGNDLAAFLTETFTNGVRDGHSFAMIEAPPSIQTVDGAKPTLADVADRRPYAINYKASQAKNWQFPMRIAVVGGQVILTQISFEVCSYEPDGKFGEKKVTRYHVWRNDIPGVTMQVYLKDDTNIDDPFSEETAPQPVSTSKIPLCVFYAKRTGVLESQPPFLDLLETNVTHYNSQSILREALKYIVPVVHIKLDTWEDVKKLKEAGITLAANRAIVTAGEHSEVKYLELVGKSLEEHRLDIENLEKRMAKLGVEKFAPPIDATIKTATEINSDDRKNMSEIAVMAKNLEGTAEQMFGFLGEYLNTIKRAGTVEDTKLKLNINWDKLTFSIDQLNFLNLLVDTGKLSKETFLNFLPQVMDMPKDFDPKEELTRIGAEKAANPPAVVVPNGQPPKPTEPPNGNAN